MEWKDATSYGQDARRGVTEPRIWEARFDSIRMSVHRVHGLDGWYLSCHQLGIDCSQLAVPTDTADEAQRVGAARLTVELEERIASYRGVIEKLQS